MKIIVTHASPDWDAIGSVWILKKFLPGWQDALVEFVPAGQRKLGLERRAEGGEIDAIEKLGEDEVIHVDTGLGPLDHHQTMSDEVCGTTRCWDYVQKVVKDAGDSFSKEHQEAVTRVVKIILADDHFKEIFWADPTADYHEFSLIGLLDGLKLFKQNQDAYYVEFGRECLNAMVHTFESRAWAEREIAEKGIAFQLKKGKAMGFETINDGVLKLAQKMGYLLVIRKDPRKGYVRIKARPSTGPEDNIDLTLAYENLRKIDPEATWFLHVSKKMLLNGTPKNPKMIPTTLSLQKIIDVIKNCY
ncbi:hypothetical protein BH11PAT1_BH11PAT1_3250 [soil metagenome]